MLSETKKQIDQYVKGKTWYWYLPVWLFGIYIFIELLHFDPNGNPPFPILIAQSFDFMLHEMAHIVTAFLPSILTASAGSISELMLGSFLVVFAFKSKSYFAVMICALWFMLTCQSAGIYMADARAQKLSLVSLGGALSGSDKVIHDWNFVFGKLHILNLDTLIGGTVRAIGIIVGLASLVFAAWLMYKMAGASEQVPMSAGEKEMMQVATLLSPEKHEPKPQYQQEKNSIYPTVTRGPLADKPPEPVKGEPATDDIKKA